jgi:hypothetical protein
VLPIFSGVDQSLLMKLKIVPLADPLVMGTDLPQAAITLGKKNMTSQSL